ncbi:methylenetetrahydrofolate reductase [NAD(P)H] [Alloprevotella sp. Lung230]|uniref:methylenetetrahydrofolate reductase [NAD(P)H] n=1 Tax=Alloprevotella sp. Lung230 TaxID=2766595 RepID=UPI001654F556|nr:methylenetetrahydrofolate reductase [NAD(P)H] [Alloprevotella sp. Lung230]MBC8625838.1 methylenetetrahydrofolate reductase [NAD(P)H] [Alloprevotella sp. Lung230]
MTIPELIAGNGTAFSYEVLPPLKGNGIDGLRKTIDRLREFEPKYINITNHRAEYVYRKVEGGLMERLHTRRRPGTVAVAAVLQRECGIPLVPHVLCSGYTREDIEYRLLDMQILGIENLLLLRGDKAREDAVFHPTEGGHAHTTDLQMQVNEFNAGRFVDGTPIRQPGQPFSYGVACYPEKHEEAPNLESDFQMFKRKVELGADYGVTQLFYDNAAYYRFVDRCRKAGITVPIIPGIKPLSKLSQLTLVPKTFRCDLPEPLAHELFRCTTDEAVKQVGIEWAVEQCRDLIAHGVPSIHFYTVSAVDSIAQIAPQVY